jgi:hypothetical protein
MKLASDDLNRHATLLYFTKQHAPVSLEYNDRGPIQKAPLRTLRGTKLSDGWSNIAPFAADNEFWQLHLVQLALSNGLEIAPPGTRAGAKPNS